MMPAYRQDAWRTSGGMTFRRPECRPPYRAVETMGWVAFTFVIKKPDRSHQPIPVLLYST